MTKRDKILLYAVLMLAFIVLYVRFLLIPGKRATTAAFLQEITILASLWNILTVAQGVAERVVPDFAPRIAQNIPNCLVIRLAWDHIAVGFHAHVVICGCATFDPQIEHEWIKMAILSGGVPDQPLMVFLGHLNCQRKQVW